MSDSLYRIRGLHQPKQPPAPVPENNKPTKHPKMSDEYLIEPHSKISLHGTEFPLEYLYRGLSTVGQPGAGKTRCILMPLVKEILRAAGNSAERKCGLLVADPKNELAPFLLDAAKEVGRQEDVVILKPGSVWYNPLSSPFLSETEVVEKIISWANNTHRNGSQRSRGDEMFWANAQRALLAALVATARAIHGEVNFRVLNQTMDRLNQYKNIGEANKWLRDYPIPEAAHKGLEDYLALPPNETRPCVSTSVSNTLYFWRHEPLVKLTTPTDSLPTIDPIDIIHHGKILVIGCSGAAFGASITPFLLALKEHSFTSLLSRDQIEVQENGVWNLINQTRPFFIVADEFQSYVSPDPSAGELTALDRLRGFRAGYIAATQNLASLHSVLGGAEHATRLIALFANQIYLSNLCPYTAHQAEFLMGKKKVKDRQVQQRRLIAPPLLIKREAWRRRQPTSQDAIVVTREVPRVDASTLSALRTGEFWVRLASGRVVKGKAQL
jgi:hypothetical protein